MSRNWNKLIELGSHGARLNELQLQVGEIIKNGGMLHLTGSGIRRSECIPPTPKGGLPNNLKLRYVLYSLAFSPTYILGSEADPSTKVTDKAWEICEKIQCDDPGYRIPESYDARKRDAIVHLAGRYKTKILSEDFQQAFTDPQNVLRFVKENRVASKAQRTRAARKAAAAA